MGDITFEVRNRVAHIQLNRPQSKNAFTLEMVDEWANMLQRSADDPEIGAVIVRGSGNSFCAGVDLSVLSDLHGRQKAHEWKSMLWERVYRIAFTLERLDKPVIAAVNGVAVGAGMDMALMCDMRFMAKSARMSEIYIRVGAVPGDGGCYYLPRLVGRAKALELMMSGDFVGAEEALRIGLVNRVCEDAELVEETQAFAERLASQSPIALRMIKRAVDCGMRSDLRTSLDLISSHMGVVMTTKDAIEALSAVQAGRPPKFTGE